MRQACRLDIISRIGHIEDISNTYQTRIFNPAWPLPGSGRFEDRIYISYETNPVFAPGKPYARGAVPLPRSGGIFGAVQQGDRSPVGLCRRIKHVLDYHVSPLRCKNRITCILREWPDLPIVSLRRCGLGASEYQHAQNKAIEHRRTHTLRVI